MSDNPDTQRTTKGPVTGQLTIAAANDVVVTGTIEYANCGAGFKSTVSHPCQFNTSTTPPNDSLGLIAENYVLVNHPIKSVCNEERVGNEYEDICKVPKASPNATPATKCTKTQLGKPTAALCSPVAVATGSTLTIDGALLALNHSFTVDNEGLETRTRGGSFGVGTLDGTLKVYGSIDQKWRGAVGIVTTSGFVKDYDWNSVGAVITPPHYLAPATPSWAVGSSAIRASLGQPSIGSPP